MKQAEIRKAKIKRYLLYLSVLTLFVVMFWVIMEIYLVTKTGPEITVSNKQRAEITSELYLELAESLNQRNWITRQELIELGAPNLADDVLLEEQENISPDVVNASEAIELDLPELDSEASPAN